MDAHEVEAHSDPRDPQLQVVPDPLPDEMGEATPGPLGVGDKCPECHIGTLVYNAAEGEMIGRIECRGGYAFDCQSPVPSAGDSLASRLMDPCVYVEKIFEDLAASRKARTRQYYFDKGVDVVEAFNQRGGERGPQFGGDTRRILADCIASALEDNWGCLGDVAATMAAQDAERGVAPYGMPWWLVQLNEGVGLCASSILEHNLSHPGHEFEALVSEGGNLVTFDPPPAYYKDLREAAVETAAVTMQMVHRIDGIQEAHDAQHVKMEEAFADLEGYIKGVVQLMEVVLDNPDPDPVNLNEAERTILTRAETAVRLLLATKHGRAILARNGITESTELLKHAIAHRMAVFNGKEESRNKPTAEEVVESRAAGGAVTEVVGEVRDVEG